MKPLFTTAVVIFIGQGNYTDPGLHASKAGIGVKSSRGFGDLMFINDLGFSWSYQPALSHLAASNTLFISLADYTDRTFERAFKDNGMKDIMACHVYVLNVRL